MQVLVFSRHAICNGYIFDPASIVGISYFIDFCLGFGRARHIMIITREQITIGLTFNAPIATLIFIASSGAKLVQCLTMMALA
jgi:hypothetical protein